MLQGDNKILALTRDVAAEIDDVAWGLSTWDTVGKMIIDAFPSSMFFVLNEDPITDVVRSCHFANIEERHVLDYAEYYSKRDVWAACWRKPSARVTVVSERDAPSRLLRESEFYNDFIDKIDNFEAAVGVRADISPDMVLRMPFHYGAQLAPLYDTPFERVLTGIHGALQRCGARLARLQDKMDSHGASTAVLSRQGMAVVVTHDMRVHDANDSGSACFNAGGFARCLQGRLSFADQELTRQAQSVVAGLVADPSHPHRTIEALTTEGHWSLRFTRLPSTPINSLLLGRTQVLVEIRNRRELAQAEGLGELGQTYKLTPAEIRLCNHLLMGMSLKDTAIATGLSFDTLRQRLKTIFHKTSTHRQAELLMLLSSG